MVVRGHIATEAWAGTAYLGGLAFVCCSDGLVCCPGLQPHPQSAIMSEPRLSGNGSIGTVAIVDAAGRGSWCMCAIGAGG